MTFSFLSMNTADFLILTLMSPVALSLAQKGLYIFGHSQNLLSRSGMWGKIIEEQGA
jgi:superfamily I DNA and/or RNA helicase